MLETGGILVLHKADFNQNSELLQTVLRLSHCQNTLEQGGYEKLLDIQYRLTNVIAGVETWLNWSDGHYISIRAVKPS
jgi:sterol 24-C-methyltransferase